MISGGTANFRTLEVGKPIDHYSSLIYEEVYQHLYLYFIHSREEGRSSIASHEQT